MEKTYTLTDKALTIPDTEAFGLEGGELYGQPDFTVVLDGHERERRSYNIYRLIIKHRETGRCFETEYSTHENEGWEWGPGMGRNFAPTWHEVYPKTVTKVVYSRRPA